MQPRPARPAASSRTSACVDYDFGFKPPNGIGVKIDAKVDPRRRVPRASTPTRASTPACSSCRSRASRSRPSASSTPRRPSRPAGRSSCCCSPSSAHSPWQIGLGFNITAVGGIIGLQHRASVDELRSVARHQRLRRHPVPGRPGEGRAAHHRPAAHGLPGRSPAASSSARRSRSTGARRRIVTARLAVLAQFAGAFGGGDFRFTRLTILGTVRATAPPLDVDAPRLVAADRRRARRLRRRVRASSPSTPGCATRSSAASSSAARC